MGALISHFLKNKKLKQLNELLQKEIWYFNTLPEI